LVLREHRQQNRTWYRRERINYDMCGEIRTSLEEWQRRAAIETLSERQGGGARFVVTELYGPDSQHGFMVDDKQFPEDWRVCFNEQGTDTRTFYDQNDALTYIKEHGMIAPTDMQLHYITHGTDVFQQYGGKALHEWISIGDLNRRKHEHPEPPENEDDIEQIKLYAMAYAMTMTEDEALNALGNMMALESILGGGRSRNPFASIGASPDLSDLLGVPQGMGFGALRPPSFEEFTDDSIF